MSLVQSRCRRCVLFVPANRPEFIVKAVASEADQIVLDLEDSIPDAQKDGAREQVINTLNAVDWGNKVVGVRINSLDSLHMHRDLIDIVTGCARLDTVMVPKIASAGDVHMVDVLLNQLEMRTQRDRSPIGLELLVESAAGIDCLDAIVPQSPRTEAVIFGLADYAASIGARTTTIGGALRDYAVVADSYDGNESNEGIDRQSSLSDAWHYPRNKILIACRVHGVQAIDGAYGAIVDDTGLASTAKLAASLGYDGKLAIHPSQIATILNAFTPTAEEVAAAQNVIKAMQQAACDGAGSASMDGAMVDVASVRMAENILSRSGVRALGREDEVDDQAS